MELVPPSLSVDPGRMGSVQVRLTNDGTEVVEVAVEVAPVDRHWSWAHPEHSPVEAGAEATFAVFFKPHCGPRPVAGSHRVEIVAHHVDDPRPLASGHATVQVGAYSDATAELHPMVGKDQRTSSYTFNLENTGNLALVASLSTEDPSGSLVLDVHPAQVSAEPGETATAAVTVQARKALKRGEQRFRVCVIAEVHGGSRFRVEGAFYQQGIKPAKK